MVAPPRPDVEAAARLLEDFSLEMTGKDVALVPEACAHLSPGTRVNVTFLAHEDLRMRVTAARAVHDLGLVPVPHVAARRLESQGQLEEFVGALQEVGASEHVFVVGGDPQSPEGPYADALSVIGSGVLQAHGVQHVGISGYPEGHPDIADSVLWRALRDKASALTAAGLQGSVITQFSFDPDAVLEWVVVARDHGVDLPIRVGVPGPAGVKRLLGYATRFGVGTSAGMVRRYGLSLTNLAGSAGPDRFLRTIAARYDEAVHGDLRIHFFTFGGLVATASWAQDFRSRG
jgi:methylenetetrahydrofolate reductase (NADPH)